MLKQVVKKRADYFQTIKVKIQAIQGIQVSKIMWYFRRKGVCSKKKFLNNLKLTIRFRHICVWISYILIRRARWKSIIIKTTRNFIHNSKETFRSFQCILLLLLLFGEHISWVINTFLFLFHVYDFLKKENHPTVNAWNKTFFSHN